MIDGCETCGRLSAIRSMLFHLTGDLADTDLSAADDHRAQVRARTFAIAWGEITAEAVRRVHEQHRADGCPEQEGRTDGN